MNLSNFIKENSYILYIIYYFITILILFSGFGAVFNSNDYLLLIIGLLMSIPLIIEYRYFNSKLKKNKREKKKELETFKRNARKIKVSLEDVEIKSNNWTEQIVIDNSRYSGLNQISGNSDRNIENIDRNLNTLIINIPINGKNNFYEYQVEMSTDRLKIKLDMQKETIYYYDPNNSNKNYLDLKFLYE